MFRPLFFGALALAYFSYILDVIHGSYSLLLAQPLSRLPKWRNLYRPVLLLQFRYLILSERMDVGGNEEEGGGEQSSQCGKASSESCLLTTAYKPCFLPVTNNIAENLRLPDTHTYTPKNIFSGCPQECVWSQPAWRCHSPLPVWFRRLCLVAKCSTATVSIKAAHRWTNMLAQ